MAFAVQGDRVLVEEDPDRLVSPASIAKLVVVAAAFHFLGPDYRCVTTVHGRAAENGTVPGDLIVAASGDPTFSERFFEDDPRAPIRSLARTLRARGIEGVDGSLLVDVSDFPGRPLPSSRALDEAAFALGAPTSALALDENTVSLRMAPGEEVGSPGSLSSEADSLRWVGEILTVGKDRHDKGTVDVLPRWGTMEIAVRGEYPISEPPYRVRVSVPDPDRWAAGEIARVFREEGLAVGGDVEIRTSTLDPSPPELARVASPPLSEISIPILEESVNWLAEMLLRVLAREVRGKGRSDEGLELLGQFLEDEVGLREDAYDLDDASGVSPYDLLTARGVVELLRYVERQAWRDDFLLALARPGEGTLESWPRLPKLRAKTGTLRHTTSLAGRLETSGGIPVHFAIVLDHRLEATPALRQEIADRLWRLRRQAEESPSDDRVRERPEDQISSRPSSRQ